MPWKTSDAPEGLPEHAKEIWAKAATAALAQYGDEKKAIATAWAAVKKAGYAKGDDGKWHKVELSEEHVAAFREGQLKQTGKYWGKVLRHVAFLGAQAPAVKGLAAARDLGQETFEKEICAVGTWNGEEITEADLDEMVANFHALKGIERVPLVMAAVHDEKEFERILEKEGLPSLGWVDDVKRVGSKLVASFTQVAKVAKDLIMEGRFPNDSIRFTRDYVFGETASTDCSIFYEPSREEGEDMAGEKDFTQADLDARVKAAVDAALAEAKTKIAETETKLTEAEKEAKEAKEALLAEQVKQTKARVAGFAEALKARRVAPVVATDFTELAKGLDNAEQVEFAEGKKATVLERAIAFVEGVLDLAEGKDEKSLFVPEGEAGKGEDFAAGEHDATKAKAVKAQVAELKEMSDRVPKKDK